MPLSSPRVPVAVVALLALLACGGGANQSPTAPTPSPGSGNPPAPPASGSACRTHSSDETAAITASVDGQIVSSGTRTTRCAFNRAALEFRCTTEHTDTQSSYMAVTTGRFASVADFVGDEPRIFIQATSETRAIEGTSTHTTGGATITSTVTNSYDGERRLARQLIRSAGTERVLTYTAWDQFGRPTAWQDGTYSYAAAFNDGERTSVVTNLTVGGTVTTRHDGNGNRIGAASSSPGGGSGTEAVTIRATETVCR